MQWVFIKVYSLKTKLVSSQHLHALSKYTANQSAAGIFPFGVSVGIEGIHTANPRLQTEPVAIRQTDVRGETEECGRY